MRRLLENKALLQYHCPWSCIAPYFLYSVPKPQPICSDCRAVYERMVIMSCHVSLPTGYGTCSDAHFFTFWWRSAAVTVALPWSSVSLATSYGGNPRVSTAWATAFYCTWRFHGKCHGCGHGTCRGSVRGNLRGANHGNPRKYYGNCHGIFRSPTPCRRHCRGSFRCTRACRSMP